MSASGSDSEAIDLEERGEGGEDGEKLTLVDQKQDGEVYSLRHCLKARSFLLALVISFITIFVILGILGISIGLIVNSNSSKKDPPQSQPTVITIDDVFNPNFTTNYYQATWTPDNRLQHTSLDSGITLFNPADNTTDTLINATLWQSLNDLLGINDTKLSYDLQYVLLVTNSSKVYRHSYLADYYIYEINTGGLLNVSTPENATGRIQYAVWSPTADVIAYVLDYDIYLYDVSMDTLTMVTSGGDENEIRYGIPDWVYEEEVLATNYALWWAPNGERLLYASFDDRDVRRYEFPRYGPPTNQYTTIEVIAYPKPGTPNPVVGLHVVNISNVLAITQLDPPSTIASDHYFVFAGWANSSVASVTWMNRTQTSAVYCVYHMGSSECVETYQQNSSAWIEIIQPPVFYDNGARFLALVPMATATGDDKFTHILQVTVESGDWQFLTQGRWEDTYIIGTNGSDILYISTRTSPGERHIYSTSSEECLTCSQEDWNVPKSTNPAIPDQCSYFSASCSGNLAFCLLNCYGPAIAYSLLVQYSEGKFVPYEYLEINSQLRESIADIVLPTRDDITIPETPEGDPLLHGKILYPPNFKSSHRYPVLVYVYGGPNSQEVDATSLLSSLSLLYYVSNLSCILVSVDGRGTGFRGDRFKHVVYMDLGKYETIDQIRAGKYLQSLSMVDGSKLAIYGASYGGYMAGMVGSSGSGVFRTAISQSPVSDWRYYDSIYTERYMGEPEDNQEGYEHSSLLQRVSNISSIDYLLIHGTGDDNVHFQHTAQLVRALTEQEIQFRLQFYTDKTHSLSGEETRRHLYELISGFLRESFQLQ